MVKMLNSSERGRVPFSPDVPKAREYSELLQLIERRDDEDRYTELMKKERRVLDTVDRVVNDAQAQKIRKSGLLYMSVPEVLTRTAETLHDVYLELFTVSNLREAWEVLSRPERRIYLGIVLVLVGLILGFVQMTSAGESGGGGLCHRFSIS